MDRSLAQRLLRLEAQVDSYRKLHEEELEGLRNTLRELRDKLLSLAEDEVDKSNDQSAMP